MLVQELIHILEEQAPENDAMDWDNSGLLVGNPEAQVHKIYIALDATDEVIDHAIEAGADMILTHHPMIFTGMKQIRQDHFIGRRIIKLIEHHMACYAMHTNFDIHGMGDLAAEKLGLLNVQVLDIGMMEDMVCRGIGCVGTLESVISLGELANRTREAFGVSHVKVFGDATQKITRIAISPGSGKSEIITAIEQHADVLITGDIDHHDGIDAVAQELMIIDAGHYGIEHIFIDYMKQYLEEHASEIEVEQEQFQEPFWIV